MCAIADLGRIGFGGYRIDARNQTHRAALHEALDAGCTLIDTASNYADGRSESLIGEVLDERPDADPFVITKAGYVSPSLYREFGQSGSINTSDDAGGETLFRIDPDSLRLSLNVSRQRLRQTALDAVLVHNPEKLLDRGYSPEEVYSALEHAFCFLEDEVTQGRLRYYGISSNMDLDLSLVSDAAMRVRDDNHFRFVEFPLNLLERRALQGEPNLIEQARRLGIQTVSNRTLNALVAGRPVRLAYYDAAAPNDSEAIFDRCVVAVANRLQHIGSPAVWSDFAPMQFLRDCRDDISEPELADILWANRVAPFVVALFASDLTAEVAATFDELREYLRQRSRAVQAQVTDEALTKVRNHLPDLQVPREQLTEAACQFCLDAGVDHVLVGMRRPAYVRSLSSAFDFASSAGTCEDDAASTAVQVADYA